MNLWEEVQETDPSNTKPVSFGRKFTAIDAYSQIKRATEIFGPIGIGWGYSVEWDYSIPSVVCADMVFWYDLKQKRGEFQVSGACDITGKGKTDSEAKKKAITDGITKALSYLGFNADVFMGKFDDSKYVADMNEKFSKAHAKRIAGSVADDVFRLLNDEDAHGLWQVIKECSEDEKIAIKVLLPNEEHHIKELLQTVINEIKNNETDKIEG